MSEKCYIAIDMKSFYASVECVARKRDPLTTNLVVADESRTEKTICLAVSPSLKSYGISGRARLFEAIQKVNEVNRQRKYALRGKPFSGKSDDDTKIKEDPTLELDFIKAPPRMAEYMKVSGQIYSVYLRDVAPEDIFAYSVDEVFIDATYYLKTYKLLLCLQVESPRGGAFFAVFQNVSGGNSDGTLRVSATLFQNDRRRKRGKCERTNRDNGSV
jgi:DNA polymerase V